MNITSPQRSITRHFELDFDEPLVTEGKLWSSKLNQDCHWQIVRGVDLSYTVSTTTYVDEINIPVYFEAVARPIVNGVGVGPTERVWVSNRELSTPDILAVVSHIRDLMSEDQAAMLRANRAVSRV